VSAQLEAKQTCTAISQQSITPIGISTIDSNGQTIFVADAHRDDGRRFIVCSDEKLSAFVELERQVLTVTFYLESIRAGDQ
jgi:hypothetical protein